jgi:hypothetical protein
LSVEIINELKDESLMSAYLATSSVKGKIEKLSDLINEHLPTYTTEIIIKSFMADLIPPGTKGVIRGNKFNQLIRELIESLHLDNLKYEVKFEKECKIHPTEEKPDWYILDKHTNKVIIGMNQLDLWNGGQQLNRGSNYILNNRHNTESSKLLCVVCNDPFIDSKENKKYKLFNVGFKNNTLCYPNNLRNIISSYFM